jgi:O-antigen ligase
MNFQRIVIGLFILLIAGLAGSFYANWKTLTRLKTVQAFVEGFVFADAVAACEKTQSTTPFKWNGGKQTAVIGLNSVKLTKGTVLASYTLVADSVYCDYDPIKKKADIGSNFLERESF